jgi:hypothetical protein
MSALLCFSWSNKKSLILFSLSREKFVMVYFSILTLQHNELFIYKCKFLLSYTKTNACHIESLSKHILRTWKEITQLKIDLLNRAI